MTSRGTRRRSRARPPEGRGWLLAAGLLCVVLFVQQALEMREAFGGLAVDDAYISFRYAENAVEGRGLVWNEGERVEGYSNFLWVVLLLAPAALGADLTVPSQVLGLAFGVAAVLLALSALRRVLGVTGLLPAVAAGALVATSGYVSAWAVSGLESSLHGLLLLWIWARLSLEHAEPGRRPLSAIPVVALALLRPEGLFVAVGAVALHLALCRLRGVRLLSREALALPLLVAAPLAAYHGFRAAYYGLHPFPNSVRAKVGLSAGQLARGLEHVATRFLWPYAPLLAGLLLCRGRSSPGPRRLAGAVGSALLVCSLLFVAAVGGDWSDGRFYAPLVPLGAVLAVAAAARLLEGAPAVQARVLWALLAGGYVALAWQVTATQRERPFRLEYAAKDAERVEIGRWLARAAPPETKVAVFAAGQIPYYSRLPAHDMLGLNDAHVAAVETPELGRGLAGHERYDVGYTLETVRPDVIVDPQHVPGMLDHPALRAGYRRERAFSRSLVLVRRDLDLAPP